MSARILPGAGRQSRVRRHLSRGLDAAARRDRARVRMRTTMQTEDTAFAVLFRRCRHAVAKTSVLATAFA